MPTFRLRYPETERRDTELGVGRIEANERLLEEGVTLKKFYNLRERRQDSVYEIQWPCCGQVEQCEKYTANSNDLEM